MEIEKGQVISDRIPEKTRLQAQEKQLQLSLLSIRTASIAPPPKPRPVPEVAALPPISYLEHQAAIERAKLAIRRSLALRDRPFSRRNHHQATRNQGTLPNT